MAFEFSDAEACQCGWLERAVAEPGVPIAFDGELNEYNLVYDGPNGPIRMLLRYCAFCGGATPKSRRAERFTQLTHSELARLDALTRNLETLQAVLSAFGPPDQDLKHGDGAGGRTAEGAPTFEWCRTLVYEHLSETAQVRALERSDGSVGFSFSGKPLASVKSNPGTDDRSGPEGGRG